LEDQQITLKLLNGSGRPDRLRRRDDVKLMWGSDGRTGRRRQSSSAPHQRKRMRRRRSSWSSGGDEEAELLVDRRELQIPRGNGGGRPRRTAAGGSRDALVSHCLIARLV
jgi:hypothetical protein